MSAQFEGELDSLKLKKKKSKMRGIMITVVSASLFFFSYYVVNIIKIPVNREIMGAILVSSILSIMMGLNKVFYPLENLDKAFLEIVEALKILEKSGISTELNEEAYKKVMNAHHSLNVMYEERKPWYSNIRKIERDFYKNIESRLAPAILKNQRPTSSLIDIAIALRGFDIGHFENVNTQLTDRYEEKEIIKNNYKEYFNSIITTRIAKIIFSFIIGPITSSLIIYIGSYVFKLDFITTIKSNLVTVTTSYLMTSLAILSILLKEK